MKKRASEYYILLVLVIMFAAPGIAAYMFYQHPSWLGATRVNKGTLLHPPLILDVLKGKPKWRIIYWSPGPCDKACLAQLDVLARLRLALGRKLYQVDQWLILGDRAPALSEQSESRLKEIDFQWTRLTASEVKAKGTILSDAKVFLADPGNYLILSYSSQVDPGDVYKDLKLLLNSTEKKSE